MRAFGAQQSGICPAHHDKDNAGFTPARPSMPPCLGTFLQSPPPTRDQRPRVYATPDHRRSLRVSDVTHPAFAIADDPASRAARRDAFLAWDRRNRRIPTIVTRLLMRLAARRSPLLRRLMASDSEYLDSIST